MISKRFALAVAVLVAILGVYVWAQTPPLPPPGVILGSDIAFRVERTESGRAIGRLMVRMDGKWLEAEISRTGRIVPLQSK